MKLALAATLAAIGLFSLAGRASAANLVTNGDFETNTPVDLNGWTQSAGNTTGWSSIGPLDGSLTGTGAREGAAALQGMFQTIPTLAGSAYTLSFDLDANGGDDATNQFIIDVGSLTPVSLTGDLIPANTFTHFSFNFTAAESNATMLIQAGMPGAGNQFILDNVSVVPASVPEPASLGLMGLGLLGLLARRRSAK